MATLDVFSTVHLGRLRTGPPATGVEPQRDDLLRAHIGRLALDDGTEFTVDGDFCIVNQVDERFCIVNQRDDVFCITR